MAKKKITLINTREWLDYDYADYLEYCESNEKTPAPEGSYEYTQWCIEQSQMNYEDEMANIENTSEYETYYLITGYVGTWNGTHDILPNMVFGLAEAIKKCFGSAEDCKVVLDTDGSVNVSSFHHDGTNHFTINEIRGYCLSAVERAIEENRYNTEVKSGWFKKIKLF